MADDGFELGLYMSQEQMREEIKKQMLRIRELEHDLKLARVRITQLENKIWAIEHDRINPVSVL